MRIFLLSELDKSPLFEGRLSDRSADEIDAKFAARKRTPTLLHVKPLDGLRKGRKFLSDIKGDAGNKILHFVSDFRDSDWTGPDSEKLSDEIKGVLEDGVNLNLIDVASPYRGTTGKVALNHDNLALIDLKADTRVAIEDGEVGFTATIMNYGQGEAHDLLQGLRQRQRKPQQRLRPGKAAPRQQDRAHLHPALPRLEQARPGHHRKGQRRGTRAQTAAAEREFFHVRVTIKEDKAGLTVDNVRDLVIEVRKKVPTLVVDGNKPEGRGEAGDMFHLQSFYAGTVYEVEERRLPDLEKADLDLYPSIILLNVGEIPAPIIARLKAYVENGGSLCYFMGEEVKSDHYNTALFTAGIFPLQIEDRPYDPLAAAGIVDPEARKKERDRLRQTVPQPKILFRDADKNILVQRLAPFASLFRYLSINVYWKAAQRSRWDPDGRKTETPIVLPNASKVDSYKTRALELTSNALRATQLLAGKEAEMKRFLPALEKHSRGIRDALSLGELFRLADELQKLLTDPGVKDDPEKPRMSDLWSHAEMKGLAADIRDFRNDVLYGDPLVVSKAQGKGRVVAILTTAGTAPRRGVGEEAVQWNNWGAGDPAVSTTYPLFLLDLHRYLISEGQAPNRLLGEEVKYQLDATRYDPKVRWTFEAQPDLSAERPRTEKETEQAVMEKAGNLLTFKLASTKPGVYKITHTLLGDGPEEDRQETRAFAYNIDAVAESNLKRAAEERLKPELPAGDGKRGTLTLRAPGSNIDEFKEKQPDASESPWLYLFFIIILVVEQAMAVHLSFHMKSNEAQRRGRWATSERQRRRHKAPSPPNPLSHEGGEAGCQRSFSPPLSPRRERGEGG